MQVAITGASGLIGRALTRSLINDGHEVRPMVRSEAAASERAEAIYWNPATGVLDPAELEGLDAVVHLAGAGIGNRRWTSRYKQEILDSRVDGTRLLAEALAGLDTPPRVLVSGSAVGFYGDRGDTVVTEADDAGDDFLAELVVAWEGAARPAAEAGIRVVSARTGIVLDRSGGVLAKMLLPFRLGLGGRTGPGTQWMSWVTLGDHIRAVRFLIDNDDLRGPVNITAPAPVTNRDYAKALGRAVHRPAVLPTPLFPLRILMGRELVDTLMLTGQRVRPTVLEEAGFGFDHPDIDAGLKAALA